MVIRLDHLVVAARTLDEGLAWCQATLGIVPTSGGRHDFMGTHNRVFSIATPAWPLAYFEIIAIDPDAPAPGWPRWFALDTFTGPPRLVHWVARCEGDIDAARAAAIAAGQPDPGRVLAAARGDLRWRITVPDDGRLVAPTLIQWASRHPAAAMPASGVELLHFDAQTLTAQLRTPLGAVTLTGS